MAKQTSKSTRLIGIIGAVLIVTMTYGLAGRNDSDAEDAVKGKTSDRLGEMLVEGDADSPHDTIRRLNQNAKSAVEKASQTDKKVNQFAEATSSKFEALTELMTSMGQDSKKQVESEMGGIKSEMQNFMTLVEGRLQKQPRTAYTAKNGAMLDQWVEITPINPYPLELASAQAAQGNTNITNYAVNNGFLLGDTGQLTSVDGEPIKTPVATIPVNSPLLNSVTLSTLIGRVPKGGQVFEPFNFYIQTGMDNWTSQDHEIPFLERAIWRGVATGDKDLECIRGKVLTVTFVFSDETIQTVEGTKAEPLAELVSTTGSNCVPGTYVSNTGKYIAMYGLGGGLAGLGEAIAQNETISNFTSNGNLVSSVNGNTGNFLAGRALSASAVKASEIIDDEYRNSFASVVLESGVTVNLMALQQIEIDHNQGGRKVSYHQTE